MSCPLDRVWRRKSKHKLCHIPPPSVLRSSTRTPLSAPSACSAHAVSTEKTPLSGKSCHAGIDAGYFTSRIVMPDYTASREKACQTIVFMEFSGLTWPIGKDGAEDGNRTRVVSLGSFCSTIELPPHRCRHYSLLHACRRFFCAVHSLHSRCGDGLLIFLQHAGFPVRLVMSR